MSETKVEQPALTDYVKAIFPENPDSRDQSWVKNVHDTVFELAESGQGAEMAKGTLWGAYNAVTEYVDHYRNPKGDKTQCLKSMWFGSGERIKKNAFRSALNMLEQERAIPTGTYG